MLFTLHRLIRYERRSLGITSNLVFSQWEHIFANPYGHGGGHRPGEIHHSVILEFDVPSYRTGVGPAAQPETGGGTGKNN